MTRASQLPSLLFLLCWAVVSPLRALAALCPTGTSNDGYVTYTGGGFSRTTAVSGVAWMTDDWSVSAWVRRTGAADTVTYRSTWFTVGSDNDSDAAGKQISLGVRETNAASGSGDGGPAAAADQNKVYISFAGSNEANTDELKSATTLPTSDLQWHHMVYTVNKPNPTSHARKIYMDSVLIASDNSATQLSGVSVANSRVGRGAKSNAGPNQGNWIGDMDELMVFNMILTPSMISSLFRGNTYGLEANCMVWLRFTEFAVGATQVAFDSSGNGNDYSSGSSLSLQTNSAGNVYCFPYCPQGTDSDGYINFPSSGGSFVGTFPSPVVFNTAGFSVEAWVRRVTAGDPTKPAIVIAVGNPADVSNARKYLHIGTRGTNEATRTSGAMTIDYGSDSLDSSTGTILRDNIWHHCVWTNAAPSGGVHQRTIFKDGAQVAQAYSGGLLNTQSLQFRIGSAQFGGPWPGDIDELMLFQAVLSADEVTRRFRGDYVSASASTLFMHLRFNEQTGTYARDSSFMLSDANTGTSQTWKAPNAAAVCLPSATLNGAGCAVGTRNDGYLSVWGDGQITTNSANIPWATSDITVEMWVKRRGQGSSSTNDCFFSVGSTSTTGAHLWFGGATTTGRPVLGFYTPDDLIEPTITYTNGAWQHMVFQWAIAGTHGANAGQHWRQFYMDNVILQTQQNSAGQITAASTSIITIGRSPATSMGYWNGDIDEIYVWPAVLSDGQVGAHFVGNFAGAGLVSQAALAIWHLNEWADGNTGVALDSSGNQAHMNGGGGTNSQFAFRQANSIASKCLPTQAPSCAPPLQNDGYVSFANTGASSISATAIVWTEDTAIEAWVRRSATSASASIFFTVAVAGASTNGQSLWCGFDASNKITLGFYGDNLATTISMVPADGWHHLLFTYAKVNTQGASDNRHMRAIFKDGVSVASGMSGGQLQPATTVFTVGKGLANNHGPFFGDLDELRIWRGYLTPAQALLRFQDAPLPFTLLASFPFNEGFGSTAVDETANHNSIAGSLIWKLASDSGNCFDPCAAQMKNDGYLMLRDGGFAGNVLPFDFNSQPFSIEMWFRRPGPLDAVASTSNSYLFSAGNVGVNYQYLFLGLRTTGVIMVGHQNDGLNCNLQVPMWDANWHHAVWTWSKTATNHYRTIYLDGQIVCGAFSTQLLQLQPGALFYLGKAQTDPWRGDIDEFSIWQTELTSAQQAAHFVGNYLADRQFQRVWLRFNEASGTTASDWSGYGNHVTGGVGLTWNPSPGAKGVCQVLQHTGYTITSPSPPVTVGSPAFVVVTPVDQYAQSMWAVLPPMGPTSVTIQPMRNGTLINTPSVLSEPLRTTPWPKGLAYRMLESTVGPVTFALTDSAGNGAGGRVYGAAASLSWTVATLDSIWFEALDPVQFSPTYTVMQRNYNITKLSAASAQIGVRFNYNPATNATTSDLYINGVYQLSPVAVNAGVFRSLGPSIPATAMGIPCSLRANLLMWLPFTGGSTTDMSGLNATISGGPSTFAIADRFGVPSNAQNFSAILNSRLETVVTIPPNSFSISCWFRTSSNLAYLWVIAAGPLPYSSADRSMLLINGQAQASVWNNEAIRGTGVYNDNVWHHCVYQMSLNRIPQQIWIDGAIAARGQGIKSFSDFTWNDRLYIGYIQSTVQALLDVHLDDFAVFNRALMDSEVAALYTMGQVPLTNSRHCVTVGNAIDGFFGFAVPPTPAWIVQSLAVQLGSGSPASSYAAATLVPPFSPSVFTYTVNAAEFNTSVQFSAVWSDPTAVGVYAKWDGGMATPLASAALVAFDLPTGTHTLELSSINGKYVITVNRPRIVVIGIVLQTKDASGNRFNWTGAQLTPPFSAGVYQRYALSIPYIHVSVSLAVTWSAGSNAITQSFYEDESPSDPYVNIPNGVLGFAEPYTIGLTCRFGVNDGVAEVLAIDLPRRPPALQTVAWDGLPGNTAVPAYVPGLPGAVSIGLEGVIMGLTLTAGFAPGPLVVRVDGTFVANATSGVPIDLRQYISISIANATAVSLTSIDGTYTFTFLSGCPAEYSCFFYSATDLLCEYKCSWCRGSTLMRICLQRRPDCCYDGSCAC